MMTQKERAKQFSSFDSLKGLDKALHNREESMESEDRKENAAHKTKAVRKDGKSRKRSR